MADTAGAEDKNWRDLLAEGRGPRLALILFGMWLTAADALVSVTIMPTIGRELGGFEYLAWATAGFFLGSILAGAAAGRLSERLGLRTATVMAGLVYGLGCALSALAPNIETFLVGRLIQGIGGGWQSGFSYVAIAMFFPDRHLGRVFAVASGVWGIATLFGPLIGGLFAEAHAWRWIFWLFAGQAVVFSFAAIALIPRGKHPSAAGVPFAQMLVLGAGIAALAAANLIPEALWAAALTLAGLGLVWAMTRVDARARVRLLPKAAGNPRTIAGAGYGAIFALTTAGMGLSVYGPAILQATRGVSPLVAGYIVSCEAVGWTLTAILVAQAGPIWADRFVKLGAICIVAGLGMLALVLGQGSLGLVAAAAGLMGSGFGLSWAFISRRILAALDDEDRTIGSSAVIAVQQTGSAAGAAIAGVAANLSGIAAGLSVSAAERASVWVFLVALPIGAVGLIASWMLVSQTRAERAPNPT
jgi:MFS family permease